MGDVQRSFSYLTNGDIINQMKELKFKEEVINKFKGI